MNDDYGIVIAVVLLFNFLNFFSLFSLSMEVMFAFVMQLWL